MTGTINTPKADKLLPDVRETTSRECDRVLEDGSIDHEWVTEFGVTFCAQCEAPKDYDK